MKYTAEQFAALRDDELNQILTAIEAGHEWYRFAELNDSGTTFHLGDRLGEPYHLDVVDYCNDTAATMKLAFTHDVTYVKALGAAVHKLDAGCMCFEYEFSAADTKPLRAIVCCLILVLQERDS